MHFRGVAQRYERIRAVEIVDVENAVHVVDFVFEGLGEEVVLGFDPDFLAGIGIDPLGDNLDGPSDLAAIARHREAAFIAAPLTGTLDDLGIDEGDRIVVADIDHHDAERDANLRCGKPDSGRVVHRFPHVFDQLVYGLIDVPDSPRFFTQDGVAGTANGKNGQGFELRGVLVRRYAGGSVSRRRRKRPWRILRVRPTLSLMASKATRDSAQIDSRHYSLIVVGSGISGLFIALEARKLGPVLVLTKGSIDDCNTRWAQGGIAAAVGPLDSPAQHLADTIAAGDGLVDDEAARVLCTEAPARIRDLIEYGVAFDSLGGEVALGREAAHSHSRILHAGGDRTGAEIETALSAAVSDPAITVLDFTLATRLIVENGRVAGVEAVALQTGAIETYEADNVVLATGGAGQLFSHTTNPDVATGDGIVLAFDAGAEVADVEFYQFHPTALRLDGAPPFLISEAVRGEGAILRNQANEAFMARYHPLRELAPRDVVARAIVSEMQRENTDAVWLDCTGLKSVDLGARFPGISSFCEGVGIDMRTQPIPVAPAAHYLMGGVRTDICGRTTLPGLFACGEVACTGVHGANRLASNSLMETVVFGKRIVEHIAGGEGGSAESRSDRQRIDFTVGAPASHAELQQMMWNSAGIVRNSAGMRAGMETIGRWEPAQGPISRSAFERSQMARLSALMLHAALARTESRGGHFRNDFPARDDEHWRRQQVWVRHD